MGLDGGGGGGGGILGVGNAYTGPAEALELSGDFAYAYSGAVLLNNETKTALAFTTGNYMCVARIQHTGRFAIYGGSKRVETRIYLNDSEIIRMAIMTSAGFSGLDNDPFYIIIPPYTKVRVEVATDDTQNLENYITLTGRIYR